MRYVFHKLWRKCVECIGGAHFFSSIPFLRLTEFLYGKIFFPSHFLPLTVAISLPLSCVHPLASCSCMVGGSYIYVSEEWTTHLYTHWCRNDEKEEEEEERIFSPRRVNESEAIESKGKTIVNGICEMVKKESKSVRTHNRK